MSLVRAVAPAWLALSLLLSPIPASRPAFADPRPVAAVSEDVQTRSLRVLAALLLALSQSASSSPALLGIQAANANDPSRAFLVTEDKAKHAVIVAPVSIRDFGKIVAFDRKYRAPTAINYKTFHTFSAPVTIMSLPITDAFAAPCDSTFRIGWPCADATETRRARSVRAADAGEETKLSVGLRQRPWIPFPDAPLGKSAHPSAYRMNLDALSQTNASALIIAKR